MKKNYPINEGWIHVSASLKAGATITQSAMLGLLGLNPGNAEVAEFRCGKTKATIIARNKNRTINAYVVKEIINIKTGKQGCQIVGLWGDEDKGEGYRIGPKFAEIEFEACEKLIDDLLRQYGLPVNLDIIIGHFKHEKEVPNG